MNKQKNIFPVSNNDQIERALKIVALAKIQHHRDGECEIDDTAEVSEGNDDGAYVQAWVWVNFDETDLDKEVPGRKSLPRHDVRESTAISESGMCAWNRNGFARKDPGKERDGYKPGGFDEKYPIDENCLCKDVSDAATVGELLSRLKAELSYPVRYEVNPKDAAKPINLRGVKKTAEKLLIHVARTLGESWQLMRFKSHFTLYQHRQPKIYAYGVQLHP